MMFPFPVLTRLAPFLLLALVAGCARTNPAALLFPAPRPAAVTPSTDPVVAFAARAQPGTQDRVVLPDGQSANVRVVRSYAAASGRECRELLVGSGMVERSRLVCGSEATGWSEARPLLRGGGAGR